MASGTQIAPTEINHGSAPSQGMYICLPLHENLLIRWMVIAQCQAQFELGTTLTLFTWPSLSLAVTNNWGGPDSSSKREWFASQTIDLLNENPDADVEWLEVFLLNVMLDEFEVNVDDESGFDVAEQILRIKTKCMRGDFGEVGQLKEKWDVRSGGEDLGKVFEKRERNEEDDETSGSDDENGDMDVNMDEAPALVKVKEPDVPEVDEDGFTKVAKKKR